MATDFDDLERRVIGYLKQEFLEKGGRPKTFHDPVTYHRDVMSHCQLNVQQYREIVARLECQGIVEVVAIDAENGRLNINAGVVELARQLERRSMEPADIGDAAAHSTDCQPNVGDNGRIFIGHGRSPVWRDLKDFLHERLRLEWDEFNREPTAGHTTKERLAEMLDSACFAFLVMTAEDEHSDGSKHARGNVIHEMGLFQGRLGFERAIVLMEEGCTEFSNIAGLTQIRFPKGNIEAKFEEIRRVLEREDIPGGGQRKVDTARPESASDVNAAKQTEIELTEAETRYLMTLSRPRNEAAVRVSEFDDFPSRKGLKYNTMMERFHEAEYVAILGSAYVMTELGCTITDRLWQMHVLREIDRCQKNQSEYIDKDTLAEAVGLTDGDNEASELQRHVRYLEEQEYVEVVRGDGHIAATRITPEGRAHFRPLAGLDLSQLD